MFETREAIAADLNYIMSSWMAFSKLILKKRPPYAWLDAKVVNAHLRPLLKPVLIRSNVMVAHAKADRNQIYGYVVYEKKPEATIVHMLVVKEVFQGLGIARHLWNLATENAPKIIHTFDSYVFSKKNKRNAQYNPYLLWDSLKDTSYASTAGSV